MIKGVIFDMDGTMVDTEKLWNDVDRQLAIRYGINFDEKVRVKMMGKRDHESLSVFKEYFHLDTSVEELIEVRRTMILADTKLIHVNKGLFELLDLLDKLSIKKSVATSAFKEFAEKTLSNFNLTERFDAIVMGYEVAHSKPDPAIFLEAAKRMNLEPSECLVLEDAQIGIEAAHRANMYVFAIPHEGSKNHDFSKSTKVLSSMEEIDENLLKSLGR